MTMRDELLAAYHRHVPTRDQRELTVREQAGRLLSPPGKGCGRESSAVKITWAKAWAEIPSSCLAAYWRDAMALAERALREETMHE